MSGLSLRYRPHFLRTKRPSTIRGVPASMTRATTRTARTHRSSYRPRMASPISRTKRIRRRGRSPIGMLTSPSHRWARMATFPTHDSGSSTRDLVSPKLDALRAYQHSLPSPPAPAGSFDRSGRGAWTLAVRCGVRKLPCGWVAHR